MRPRERCKTSPAPPIPEVGDGFCPITWFRPRLGPCTAIRRPLRPSRRAHREGRSD